MIIFQPEGVSYINNNGETILEAARNTGVWLESPCGGNGSCGKCKVKLLVGEANQVTEEEKKIFTKEQLEEGWRLACRVIPKQYYRTIEVERVYEEEIALTQGFGACVRTTSKKELQLWQDRLRSCISDFEEIQDHKEGEQGKCEDVLGLAIDVGTTNMEALLWNMTNKSCLAHGVVGNPLQVYGADVVSRITYARRGVEEFETLCLCLQQGIQELIKSIADGQEDKINRCVITANGVMMHFLRGESIEGMAVAPFENKCMEASYIEGGRFGLPHAKVEFPANIQGFVGADMRCVLEYLQASDMLEEGLVLDIGTNGELAFIEKDTIYVASTAAGPAFEGASISCGMRGELGAIRDVKIEKEEVSFSVIGDINPKGICGSGLVSLVAKLRKAGVINQTGYMLHGQEARAAGCNLAVVARLRAGKDGTHFYIGKGVELTQQDIRELQLAKAAIAAGCKVLLEKCGALSSERQRIYLAGAFGTYLDKEAAMEIGLLPKGNLERVQVVGNGALLGACRRLWRGKEGEDMRIKQKLVHISLAEEENFEQTYLDMINLE